MTDLVIAAHQVARGMEFLASRLVSKHCAPFSLIQSNYYIAFCRSGDRIFVVFVMHTHCALYLFSLWFGRCFLTCLLLVSVIPRGFFFGNSYFSVCSVLSLFCPVILFFVLVPFLIFRLLPFCSVVFVYFSLLVFYRLYSLGHGESNRATIS